MTASERILTEINAGLFFKEFTFAKNEFCPADGTKELADNIVWIDDILLVFQVKGREPKNIRNQVSEVNWFNKTVCIKAKKQIKDTISFFKKYNEIPVSNRREQAIDISQASLEKIRKIIIYESNSEFLENERCVKMLQSATVGPIHLFHLEDYYWVSKLLATPAELDEYLAFRETFWLRHRDLDIYPEQYTLSHFLNTDDTSQIHLPYIEALPKLVSANTEFNMAPFLDHFFENIDRKNSSEEVSYHKILKEIAKLNRHELKEFKLRFKNIAQYADSDTFSLPERFVSGRTGCGFVFIPLTKSNVDKWENALLNFTDIYKYKHKLEKAVGVVASKDGEYYQFNWCYTEYPWVANPVLEKEVQAEIEFYGKSRLKQMARYDFTV